MDSIAYVLSIHDLTRRSTNKQRQVHVFQVSFNSRPHEEVDTAHRSVGLSPHTFQFTTSRGGRPADCPLIAVKLLSIHDLTRRSTLTLFSLFPAMCSFNSRPHEEVDGFSHPSLLYTFIFQFTTSRGGRRKSTHRIRRSGSFQFTTSRGGRRSGRLQSILLFGLSIHDLTRRSTKPALIAPVHKVLSIHDLTRRSTYLSRSCIHDVILSIHDLTRRSTTLPIYKF